MHIRSPSGQALKAEGYIDLELRIKITAKERDANIDQEKKNNIIVIVALRMEATTEERGKGIIKTEKRGIPVSKC